VSIMSEERVKISLEGKPAIEDAINQLDGEINEIIGAVNAGGTVVENFGSEATTDIGAIEAKLRAIDRELQQTRRDGLATAHAIESMVQRSYGVLNQVLGIFGNAIGGVLGAVVQAAFMTAGTILALAQAESITPGMWFNAVMSFTSAGLALVAAVKADMERQHIETTVATVQRQVQRAATIRVTI